MDHPPEIIRTWTIKSEYRRSAPWLPLFRLNGRLYFPSYQVADALGFAHPNTLRTRFQTWKKQGHASTPSQFIVPSKTIAAMIKNLMADARPGEQTHGPGLLLTCEGLGLAIERKRNCRRDDHSELRAILDEVRKLRSEA